MLFVDPVKRGVLTLVGGDTAVQKWTLVLLLLRFSFRMTLIFANVICSQLVTILRGGGGGGGREGERETERHRERGIRLQSMRQNREQ